MYRVAGGITQEYLQDGKTCSRICIQKHAVNIRIFFRTASSQSQFGLGSQACHRTPESADSRMPAGWSQYLPPRQRCASAVQSARTPARRLTEKGLGIWSFSIARGQSYDMKMSTLGPLPCNCGNDRLNSKKMYLHQSSDVVLPGAIHRRQSRRDERDAFKMAFSPMLVLDYSAGTSDTEPAIYEYTPRVAEKMFWASHPLW